MTEAMHTKRPIAVTLLMAVAAMLLFVGSLVEVAAPGARWAVDGGRQPEPGQYLVAQRR